MIYPYQLEDDFRGERWKVNSTQIMAGVHSRSVCEAPCVLHNPTDHALTNMRLRWNKEKHYFERICDHNMPHPEPDDDRREAVFDWHTHCDGCCS